MQAGSCKTESIRKLLASHVKRSVANSLQINVKKKKEQCGSIQAVSKPK